MPDLEGRLEAFHTHHEVLMRDVQDHRDAVLNPSREFDHHDYAEFLRERVIPHAEREEEVLYRRVDEAVGTQVATAGMRADHEELDRRIDALETLEPDGALLPLVLHEFTALLEHHVQKEGEVLFPFLQGVVDDEALESLLGSLLDDHKHE